MSTLLLRFAAPMQSWGVDSKFDLRNTGRTPSKSGVVGFCASALGYRRDEDDKIAKLTDLKFGVRTDKAGVLMRDFHTAKSEKAAYVTTRYYLSDAAFLVGLEGDEDFLHEIDTAVRAPAFPLYLGRRSCPPEGRVSYGVVPNALLDALKTHPSIADTRSKPRIVMDTDKDGYFLRDLPLSFNPVHRKFDYHRVCEFATSIQSNTAEEHDALAELEAMLCT